MSLKSKYARDTSDCKHYRRCKQRFSCRQGYKLTGGGEEEGRCPIYRVQIIARIYEQLQERGGKETREEAVTDENEEEGEEEEGEDEKEEWCDPSDERGALELMVVNGNDARKRFVRGKLIGKV